MILVVLLIPVIPFLRSWRSAVDDDWGSGVFLSCLDSSHVAKCWRRPIIEGFRICGFHIDTAMAHGMAKVTVPVRAM